MDQDFGSSSFLMGVITGMVTAWILVIYVSIVRKEDR